MYREENRQVPGHVRLPADVEITTAPKYPLRGHQFGYRPKVNSYDGWTADMWEQYIRDLAVFGTNAYEMMPPRTDDAADSPHFPLPQIEMMAIISGILDKYDLDVWIWYPALDKDYTDPATLEFALAEWEAVFEAAAPDRRDLRPRRRPRPHRAEGDVPVPREADRGPEAPPPRGRDVALAPGLRRLVDGRLLRADAGGARVAGGDRHRAPDPRQPRHAPGEAARPLPDPTLPGHHPLPELPVSRSTSGTWPTRSPRAARSSTRGPSPQTAIFRKYDEAAIGFITYSEGINDDVNKIVWSELGWDPETRPVRHPAPLQPLLHRTALRRHLRPGAPGPRAELDGSAADEPGGRDDPGAVPGHGEGRQPPGPPQLALPAGALPRLLRRLQPPSAAVRDGPREAGDGRAARRPASSDRSGPWSGRRGSSRGR